MYMPGRSRTGSSPSRTVMSLAVYVASLIEKALETGRLRALRMVPEQAVGIPLGKRHCGRFCDDFAKVLVLDPGCEFNRLHVVFLGRLHVHPNHLFEHRPGRFGKRADREAEARRRELAERSTDAVGQLAELERPRRGARVDVQGSVASDSGGPRISCDLGPDRTRSEEYTSEL